MTTSASNKPYNGSYITKEYFEAKIESLQNEIRHLRELFLGEVTGLKELYVASEKFHKDNLDLATKNTDKEFTKTNEFRGQLDDMIKTLAPKNDIDSLRLLLSANKEAVNEKVDQNKETLDNKMIAMKDELLSKIKPLELANSGDTGRTDSIKNIVGYIFGVLGLLIAAISIILNYSK